jgi:hypothetical protein
MPNYFQCPSCGSPNESKTKCEYCGINLADVNTLSISKTNKGLFDLGIYEFHEFNYQKSLSVFEEIIKYDPSNKVAWFYKFSCEFLINTDLRKYLSSIDQYDLKDIYIGNLFVDIIKIHIKKSKIGELYNLNVLNETCVKTTSEMRAQLLTLFISRYSSLLWRDTGFTKSMLNEIEKFFKMNAIIAEDIFKIQILIEHISTLILKELRYYTKMISINDNSNALKKLALSDFNQHLNQRCINILERHSDIFTKTTIDNISESKGLTQRINSLIATQSQSKNSCFIATAAMGSCEHPVVIDLRNFRDRWLLNRNWGVKFINWYYRYGPCYAEYIENSLILKKLTYYIIVRPLHIFTKAL